MHLRSSITLLAATVLLGVACSTASTTPTQVSDPEACATLSSACHPYDRAGGLPAECHDVGHAGDLAQCNARRAECLAACPPVSKADAAAPTKDDGGAPSDGGATSEAGASAACTAHCACLGATCSGIAGYPHANEAACLSACAAQSADDVACFATWCTKAKASGDKHDCEHAWGKFGRVECD